VAPSNGESRAQSHLCPSVPFDTPNAQVFGVSGGSVEAPRVHYLRTTISLPFPGVRELAEGVDPSELFRTAAPCAGSQCGHNDGGRCTLIDSIIGGTNPVVDDLPRCRIRNKCMWWAQVGAEACHRCPQVVTLDFAQTPQMRGIAQPKSIPGLQLEKPAVPHIV
jgi:hypothetical protein